MPDVASIYRTVRVMGIPRGEVVSPGVAALDLSDPVQQAMIRRRELVAQRIEEDTAGQLSTQAQLDAKRLELEAAKLDLEEESLRAKLAALRAEREKLQAPGEGKGDASIQALIALLAEQNKAALAESQESKTALFSLLNEQIEASRHRPEGEGSGAAASVTISERVAELVALRQAMAELFPPPPPAPGVSPHHLLEMRQAELNLDLQRARLAEESAERLRRLQLEERRATDELALKRETLEVEQQRNAKFADLIQQIGPVAVSALVSRFAGGQGDEAPQQQQLPPPEQHRCSACGAGYLVRAGTTGAIVCPHCHAYQELPAAS